MRKTTSSIDEKLNKLDCDINEIETKGTRLLRKKLIGLGMKKEFTDKYTLNRTGGGEWIIDTVDNNIGFARFDVLLSDNLTLDTMRTLARDLDDETLASIGL